MSGHSKWSTIKRQKGINDSKKAKVYTKVANQIVAAVRQAGADENTNFSLKMALGKARVVDMPSESIERAIKKALGEGKSGMVFERVTYDAYGFNGAIFIIDALTENRSRTAADIRMIVEKNGGRIVESGSLSWQFGDYGVVTLLTETSEEKKERDAAKWNKTFVDRKLASDMITIDDFQITLMDQEGVEDIQMDQEEGFYVITIYTIPSYLDAVRKMIIEKGIAIEQVEMIKKPKIILQLDENDLQKNENLLEVIEGYDDVENVWTNLENI